MKKFFSWLNSGKWDIWCTIGVFYWIFAFCCWYFELGWFAK